MKILSTNQIYLADQATIKSKPISSIDLMENAASKCFDWIHNYIQNKDNIFIFCGTGNNGGDGLVIARRLIQANYKIKVFIVNFSTKKSSDFKINYDKLIELNHIPIELSASNNLLKLEKKGIIIDAIFGIGLSRAPSGFVKKIINTINETGCEVISIDIPSGLFAEKVVEDVSSVVKANFTLTFQNPKLAFFLPENQFYFGDWKVLNIGLNKKYIQSLNTPYETIELKQAKLKIKKRKKFSHKGTYGHSLIIGGSFGKIGAVVLASKAALRVGSGLVTAYIPKCGYSILQISNPEVMVEVDDEKYIQYFNYKSEVNVIGIGVGLGTNLKTINGFSSFLKSNKIPLVLDADALNILSTQKSLLKLLPKNSVITPHPKEFERLVGTWNNDYEKLDKLMKFSNKYALVVVLKGANSAIAYQNKIYFNTTGNPGLATAGSGDVLTGMITGLIAQNYAVIDACIIGVYLHGLAADIGISKWHTMQTLIASDIINFLPNAFKKIGA